MLSSYRNQSNDLHSKSIDWFLYEGNTGTNFDLLQVDKHQLSEQTEPVISERICQIMLSANHIDIFFSLKCFMNGLISDFDFLFADRYQ